MLCGSLNMAQLHAHNTPRRERGEAFVKGLAHEEPKVALHRAQPSPTPP